MKQLNMAKMKEKLGKDAVEQVLIEVLILRAAAASEVVKLMHFYQQRDNLFLVMEMAMGTLRDLVQAIPNKKMNQLHSAYYALIILEGLIYLHRKGIIHRDFSYNNVLISATSGRPLVQGGAPLSVPPSPPSTFQNRINQKV